MPKQHIPSSYLYVKDYIIFKEGSPYSPPNAKETFGLFACQCHGEYAPSVALPPSEGDYTGKVLRLNVDGSVVSRDVRYKKGDDGRAWYTPAEIFIDNP